MDWIVKGETRVCTVLHTGKIGNRKWERCMVIKEEDSEDVDAT